MMRRPPRSTLFPTRRSSDLDGRAEARGHGAAAARGVGPAWRRLRRGGAAVLGGPGLEIVGGDRKSTRLNSSHVATSYAVFCLKKQNNQDEPRHHHPHIHPEL